MSMLGDIYRNDDSDEDLERVIEQDREHDNDQSENEGNQSEAEEAPRRVDPNVEKKVKVVKNPRFVLNPKRLTGPRGIQTIEGEFTNFKFKGKGYEKDDLDLVMKKLEHWAHRLYPKFQFDDCINKIATLGKKKEVMNHIRKIRLNMLQEDVQIVQRDDDSDDNIESAPNRDEFDILLDQQIALARSTPAANSTYKNINTNADDHLTTVFDSLKPQIELSPAPAKEPPQITEEQRQRMLMNKALAEKKRLERLQKMNQQVENDLQEISS